MKNAIREYIELSDNEKEALCKSAIFVFDTNVFLNLYRYSSRTRDRLIDSIRELKPRIWMPYQVAYEFCKDRYDVITKSDKRFDACLKEADKLLSGWVEELRLDKDDSDIKELKLHIEGWINTKKKKYSTFSQSEDFIFNELLDLFDGRVGKPFSDDEKKQIEQDGAKRYEKKIPPGYKDKDKDGNKYGDILVWKEIINYSNSERVDIIFVTHDQKEDWWNIVNGKTIGPRVELRKEFYEITGKTFHMYTMSRFLSLFAKNGDNQIDDTTIKEVKLFNNPDKIREYNVKIKDFAKSYENFIKALSTIKNVDQIKSRIDSLENKNIKRIENIARLERNSQTRVLSDEEHIALKRNMQNLKDAEDRILHLRQHLTKLKDQFD